MRRCVCHCKRNILWQEFNIKTNISNFMKLCTHLHPVLINIHQLLVEVSYLVALLIRFFQNFWNTQISGSSTWNQTKVYTQHSNHKN